MRRFTYSEYIGELPRYLEGKVDQEISSIIKNERSEVIGPIAELL